MSAASAARVYGKDYRGWDAWWLEHGRLELILVPQIGGRVMGVRWRGEELTWVNPACHGQQVDVSSDVDPHALKRHLGFVLWGGDKTWLAPQERWTDGVPFLDLDSGPYDLVVDQDRGKAIMTSGICRETGVQIEREVSPGSTTGTWTVAHRLRNRSAAELTWALWDVTMVRRPARVWLPTRSDSPHPQGVKTFSNEGDSAHLRDSLVELVDGVASISCREPLHFKFGTDGDSGAILAVLEVTPSRWIAYRKRVPTFHPRPYAHGCVAEVFNSPDHPYLELELHGPLVTLAAGETFELVEEARVFDLDVAPGAAEARRYLQG